MIQDILPNKLDNSYKNKREPRKGDIFAAFKDNKVIIKNETEFFRYEDFEALPRYIYLFSINKEGFFLADNIKCSNYAAYNLNYFREFHPRKYAFAAVTAYHMFIWYRDNVFCGRCGSKTDYSQYERAKICPKCGNIIYPKISPAVIVGITDKDKILLVKYAGGEYANYALIAGFSEIGETFEETVKREVMEEVGLKVKNIKYYASQPWGFSQSLLAGYFAELDGDSEVRLEETELKEAVWKTREEIPPNLISQMSLTGTMIEHFRKS